MSWSVIQANASYFVGHSQTVSFLTSHHPRQKGLSWGTPSCTQMGGAHGLQHSLQSDGVPTGPRLAVANQVTSFFAGLKSTLSLRPGDGAVIPAGKRGAGRPHERQSKWESTGCSLNCTSGGSWTPPARSCFPTSTGRRRVWGTPGRKTHGPHQRALKGAGVVLDGFYSTQEKET